MINTVHQVTAEEVEEKKQELLPIAQEIGEHVESVYNMIKGHAEWNLQALNHACQQMNAIYPRWKQVIMELETL